ncbi:MAG TPA: tetratricopeptide repeat protein [Vicinamibacterales bacterium]|nr:tetratricopeptide repeat protein [Vicinamibacterales bacterium]
MKYPMFRGVVLLIACCVCVPRAVTGQNSGPADTRLPSLEDARRLTWRTDTRPAGIAALRQLAQTASPDARFELGRVLTWDRRTRTEGIAVLRGVVEFRPGDMAATETLAEVLAWDLATRDEGVGLLRRILEEQPARVSARLKLAEILSWNAGTRDEARSLYLKALGDEPESVEAAVGLARTLSWSGRIAESRRWYHRILARDPSVETARVGIAETDGWEGRPLASLGTLAQRGAASVETPDAFRVRAEAYSRIGRPAQALAEYDRLLALDPTNATALEASRSIRNGLRPTVEIGTQHSTASGSALTELEGVSVPFRVAFHPEGSDVELSMTGARETYRNGNGVTRRSLVGAGLDTPLGNRLRMSVGATIHDTDGGQPQVMGRTEFQVALTDRLSVRVGAARDQISSSRICVAGETIGGSAFGPCFVTQALVGVSAQRHGWDGWAQGTLGSIRGQHLANNQREELFAGAGKSFRIGGSTLRAGYALTGISFQHAADRFPVSFDQPDAALTTAYFSPRLFTNHMARLDLTLPVRAALFDAGFGIGRQRVKEDVRYSAAPPARSSDAHVGIRVPSGGRMSIRGEVSRDNVADAFNRIAARVQLVSAF